MMPFHNSHRGMQSGVHHKYNDLESGIRIMKLLLED